MQHGTKTDLVYLLIVLESIAKIEQYSESFTNADEFYNKDEQLNFNASLLLLANIGEQSAKISKELKTKYNSLDWLNVKNLRNRIVHDYTGIDFELTFRIIKKELPELKFLFCKIIQEELRNKNFEIEDYNVAKDSFYYRHIDFNSIL